MHSTVWYPLAHWNSYVSSHWGKVAQRRLRINSTYLYLSTEKQCLFFFFRNAEKILIIVIDYCDMYGRINIVNAFHVAYIEICLQPYIYGQAKEKNNNKIIHTKVFQLWTKHLRQHCVAHRMLLIVHLKSSPLTSTTRLKHFVVVWILLLSLDCVTLFWNAKSMHYVLKVCNRLYRCWLLVAFMRFLCIHLNMPCHHISNTLVFIRPMEFRYNNRRTNAVSVWIVHVASDLHWLIVYSFNYDFSMARHELDCYLDLRVCFFFFAIFLWLFCEILVLLKQCTFY